MIDPKKYLLSEFSNHVKKKTKFVNWVDKMYTGNLDSQRILCSVAIDIVNNLCCKDAYIVLFDQIDYDQNVSHPHERLENAISENPSLHFYSTQEHSASSRYIRVLTIDVLVEHYINKSKFTKTLMPDDIPFLKEKYISKKFKPLEVATNMGSTPRELVFVAEKFQFEDRINNSNNLANKANIELGLKKNKGDELVYLIYPHDFNEGTFQPITINSGIAIENNVYISYKKEDGYGRTRSRKQDFNVNGLKERVHKPVYKLYKYDWEYLDIINDDSLDIANIVNDSKKRLND